ncbi:MAG: hypothetical protein KKE23_03660 [Nanoarchaeota archaeon]|nr:hypothetical protein [Nanoarchaeota archaeon]
MVVMEIIERFFLILSKIQVQYPWFLILVFTLLIVFYALFVWKFYRFIAERDLIKLDLDQYNTSADPTVKKIVAALFFMFEYILVIPFMVLFWFSMFSIFLLILSESTTASQIILISATIIAAVRITAYYKQGLSKDLAKLLPFTLLAVMLLNPNFFSLDKIIGRISEIPSLFNIILIYLVFIWVLEAILRGTLLLAELFIGKMEAEED